jgi:hypothetical protein
MRAIMGMKKIIIADLQAVYEADSIFPFSVESLLYTAETIPKFAL